MLNRQPLGVNNRVYSPVSGSQWYVKYPKSIEPQTTKSWSSPGRGQQGESVTGGPNTKRTNIRKGPMR